MAERQIPLADLLYKAGILETSGDTQRAVTGVVSDSRKATVGSLFVAVKGLRTDGHQYIDKAISGGAAAVVCETLPGRLDDGVAYVRVSDSRSALATIAANFHGNPSGKLQLIGVTGTNGKTTVARMLHHVFSQLGYRCGLISTIGNAIADKAVPTEYTTPDPLTINRLLAEMVETRCKYAFIEVSSHALKQGRVDALRFAGAIFTNLSHDHLDYHKNARDYLKAKQKLFDNLDGSGFALTNLDDKNGMIMVQNSKARKLTYGLRAMADYKGKVLEKTFSGMLLQVDQKDVWCKLTGAFNAYNCMAAYGAAKTMGENSEEILTAISHFGPPEGRFDIVKGKNKVIGIVDYAHTPDALKHVLETINDLRSGNETLITVIGCGGDRDKSKRGAMAAIATTHSDKVVFTSDNPRFEDPEAIIDDMKKGLDFDPNLKSKYLSITKREEAIRIACVMARKNDIVLVAGKGHEKYQETGGKKLPCDDKAILIQLLNR